MDLGRYPCVRKARVHVGDGAPIVDVLWYRTTLTKCVELSIINRREWDNEKWFNYPIGELPQYGPYRDYSPNGEPRAGLTGLHVCHPEWMASGEPWPTTLPPTVYDEQDIPECCGRRNNPARGGFTLGGEAGDVFAATDPAAGGFKVGGFAGSLIAGVDPAEGGFAVGGAAGDVFAATDPAEGGFAVGGEAGDVYAYFDAAEGGFTVGGEAGDVQQLVDGAAGGLSVGGQAGDVQQLVDGAAGGLVMGNASGDVFSAVDAAEGGFTVGGEAGDVYTPAGALIWENGTVDDHGAAYGPLNDEFEIWIANSFDVEEEVTTATVKLIVWFLLPDTPTTLRWGLSDTPGGTDLATNTEAGTWTDLGGAATSGWERWQIEFPMVATLPAGTYWLTVFGVPAPSTDGAYWEEALDGPSAEHDSSGPDNFPSEWFRIDG